MITHPILIDHSATFGRVELTDRDRLDLLHRMSTGDLNALHEGEGRATVLTTALARIIDQWVVYHRGETALAVTSPGMTRTARLWLQKHIFFNDRVKTRDVSAETVHFGLYGAGADTVAEQIAPGSAGHPLHHFLEFTVGSGTALIARTFPIAGAGYTLIAPSAERDALLDRLGGLEFSDEATYQRLRIAAGIPASGHELTEDYIPLEAGLWDAVSFAKGCYIGQEIIARMESRNKLAKTLVRLRLTELTAVGTPILAEGKTVGSLTSSADDDEGGAVGLGYVRVDALDKLLMVGDQVVEVVHIPEKPSP